jgi:hypothetical protein
VDARPAPAARCASTALRHAVTLSQPPGLGGTPALAHAAAALLAERVLKRVGAAQPRTRCQPSPDIAERTSMVAPGIAGIRAAQSIAASRSATSIR